jgi:RNA polymerase sigma-70 factor, ECF subfamily
MSNEKDVAVDIEEVKDTKLEEEFSLKRLKAGEKAEFAKLVETYSAYIYRLGLKMLNNPQDAEDILQETFMKAYRNMDGFDGRSKVSTWLYRIATNEALMLLRRRNPEAVSIDSPIENAEGEQEPVQVIDWCCLPEEELMSAEVRLQLDKAIDDLPHTLRVVFLLRDIEGFSTRETAEMLNLTETAVKTRLSRARLKLREDLSTYFKGQMKGEKHE